jgi:hypothetical protein
MCGNYDEARAELANSPQSETHMCEVGGSGPVEWRAAIKSLINLFIVALML